MNVVPPSVGQIALFRLLFKVREDVFAIRWEKGSKRGYMPSYTYDPYMYRLHKMRGGTFKNFSDKSYLPFSDQELSKHFNGNQHIGGYPLLSDNSSWFIVADFDKHNWKQESVAFIEACDRKNIPAYLERSRSGNGAHVWVFFDVNYPAIRSRKIVTSILEELGVFSKFDKGSSFDRLFPNQDFHSGRGLGNLIALPFHKYSVENGNSCFLNRDTFLPFSDQWGFLSTIKRVDSKILDKVYESVTERIHISSESSSTSKMLEVSLDDCLRIKRYGLTSDLINYLKDELNFTNTEFYAGKKSGNTTRNTKRYLNFIEDRETEVIIPRGFTGKLIQYCSQSRIEFKFNDQRRNFQATSFSPNINLLSHQIFAVQSAQKKDYGVVVAPPGSGKTVIGLDIIAKKQLPALIIVHRKQLVEQWIGSVQTFLGVPKREIGMIGQGKGKIGRQVTIAMIQSLSKKVERQPEIAHSFGTILIDECHHIPAESYSATIAKLSPRYQYGLTATPFRKYNEGKVLFIHLGEIIAEIKPNDIENFKRARIEVKKTGFKIPYNPKTDSFETLSKMLIHDTARNELIVNDVIKEVKNGRKGIIITERTDHIKNLHQYLKQFGEVITLSGQDKEKDRIAKWTSLRNGGFQILITTGQFFGEGSDLQNVSRLFLAYPFSFKGKLTQYIGRVQRSEITPIIYDYHDHEIDYLHRLFLRRNRHYRNLDKQVSLFQDSEEFSHFEDSFVLEESLKLPIEQLDFQYGIISFVHAVDAANTDLIFEIENDIIRPEFNVLKEYFAKVLKAKNVVVDIYAEFQDHVLVSQSAHSHQLDRINQDIVESVKFQFIQKNILNRRNDGIDENFKNINQVQPLGEQLYNSEEDLLEDLLLDGKVKHARQLKYLALKHEKDILKLRFVLTPFSFVFLLSGREQFHLVLETLDTEEATYVWHFPKSVSVLKTELRSIEKDLDIIRNEGRKSFLDYRPDNFDRVLHDYSDDRKGFVLWKDQLEELLV